MGIDSQLAFGVVDRINQAGLLGKGAGHVLLKLTEKYDYDVRAAANHIMENKDVLNGLLMR